VRSAALQTMQRRFRADLSSNFSHWVRLKGAEDLRREIVRGRALRIWRSFFSRLRSLIEDRYAGEQIKINLQRKKAAQNISAWFSAFEESRLLRTFSSSRIHAFVGEWALLVKKSRAEMGNFREWARILISNRFQAWHDLVLARRLRYDKAIFFHKTKLLRKYVAAMALFAHKEKSLRQKSAAVLRNFKIKWLQRIYLETRNMCIFQVMRESRLALFVRHWLLFMDQQEKKKEQILRRWLS
jgi:hypothetical protein